MLLGRVVTVLIGEDTVEAEFDPASVTPGVVGFIVTALFALAVILLGWDLVRRLRRSRYRAEIAEELRAELAEREAADRAGASPVDSDGEASDGEASDGAGPGSRASGADDSEPGASGDSRSGHSEDG